MSFIQKNMETFSFFLNVSSKKKQEKIRKKIKVAKTKTKKQKNN